jgi:hypothetical protein
VAPIYRQGDRIVGEIRYGTRDCIELAEKGLM